MLVRGLAGNRASISSFWKKKYIHTSSFESPFITDSSLGSKNAKLHTLAPWYRKLYNVDTWLSRIYLNKVEV